jgi:hypothetical protein
MRGRRRDRAGRRGRKRLERAGTIVRTRLSLICLLAAAGALLCAAATASPAAARTLPRGLALPNVWFTDPLLRTASIGDVRTDLRADWLRLEVFWRNGEPRQGVYDNVYLGDIAATCQEAHDAGLKVMLTFFRVPQWASDSTYWDRPPWGMPKGYQDYYVPKDTSLVSFQSFVGHVATLCRGNATAYECWNEPNLWLSLYPQKTADDPQYGARKYLEILKRFRAGVKNADPDGQVVGLALGPYGDNSMARTSPQRFASQCAQLGAGQYMDYISHHPYQTGVNCRFPPEKMPLFHDRGVSLANLNAVIKYYPGKPVYLTEYAYNVKYCRSIGGGGGVGLTHQAEYLKRAYAYAARYPRVKAMFWFLLRDENDWSSGLRATGADGTPYGAAKPAWYAFSRSARITLSKPPRTVAAGSAVRLTGRLSYRPLGGSSVGVARKRVDVQRLRGGKWIRVRGVITGADGTYVAIVHPTASSKYRIQWAGVANSVRRQIRVR